MLSKAHGAAPTDRELKPLRDVMSLYLRALYEHEVRPMLDYFRYKQQLMTAQEKARKDASTLEGCEDALAESAREGTAGAKWLQERRPEEQSAASAASSSDSNDAVQTAKCPRVDTTTTANPSLHGRLQGLLVDVIGCVASYLPTKSAVAGLACTCKALHAHVFASLTRVGVRYMTRNFNHVAASFPRLSHLVLICRKGTEAIVEGFTPEAWLKNLEVQLHERLTGLEVVLEAHESREVVAWLCKLDWPKLELLYVQRHLPLVLRAAEARPFTFLPNLHTIGSRAIMPPIARYRRPSTRESEERDTDDEDDGSDAQVTPAELIRARSKGHLPKLQRVIQPDCPPCRKLNVDLHSVTEVVQVLHALNTSGTASRIQRLTLDLDLENPEDRSLEQLTLRHEGSADKRQESAWLPALLSDGSYPWLSSVKELVLSPLKAIKIKEAELASVMKALLRRTVNLLKLTLPECRDGAVVAVLDVLKEDGCLSRLHQVSMTVWGGSPRAPNPMPGNGASLLIAAWLSHQREAQQARGDSDGVRSEVIHGPYRSDAVRRVVESLGLSISSVARVLPYRGYSSYSSD